ncbi:MAG TPA: methionine biosynthesis protein MetW [Lentisphaeria bacterium]|nr:MAG: methionine biosynthesis protein MetW [Lentisphaerae bacterium GWF2_49_21]HBC87186.1 methionine biosynthesis protein MetW [Lentisphaeria bacterium]
MTQKIRDKLAKRPDILVIAEIIPPNSRILDLGCGDGSLLELLRKEKNVYGSGIEFSQEKILDCVSAGVPVVHGDLNKGLREFPDKSFDYVVLSQTLQAVERPDQLLEEMMRVGKKVIVSIINIGYYTARSQIMFQGKMPVTDALPLYWYNTPNIHLGTVCDFRNLCKEKKLNIVSEIPIGEAYEKLLAGFWPNLFAPTCVFVIE